MISKSNNQQIELYVSCRKLKNLDFLSKSDPQVRFYLKENGKWKLVGKTETKFNNLDPDFTKTFIVDFVFETQQPIKFEVVDIDDNDLFDLLGTAETTLGAIMGARGQIQILNLLYKGTKGTSKLIVRGEKCSEEAHAISWSWSGLRLINTDGGNGKSDPFLRFFKSRPEGDALLVHQTERINDNLNPVWKPFQVSDSKLCVDHIKPFKVECWDWQKDGEHQFMGACEISLEEIKNGKTQVELRDPKKKKSTGFLKISDFSIQGGYSFIDYLRGGTHLNAIVAIDFTSSNGTPTTPNSLHFIAKDGTMNEYQRAIISVCQIILNYDCDQKVPVFGFGAKPQFPSMSSTSASHCFPCNGDSKHPEVLGLEGIIGAYANTLRHVEFEEPTLFAPLINEVSKLCQKNKEVGSDVYMILLIVSDGQINDMVETKDAIVQASKLPLSIIIVGVGDEDFKKMEILDGDKGLYNSDGEKAERDLVQFVPFKNFTDMLPLAQSVLAEIPDQLVEYMRLINKAPRPPQILINSSH